VRGCSCPYSNTNSGCSSAATGHLMGRGRVLLWMGLGAVAVEAQCALSVDAQFVEAQCALSVGAQFASCVTRFLVGRGFDGTGVGGGLLVGLL
jgi:hypothetical protein